MLDPVFFFFKKRIFSHQTLFSASHYGKVSALLEDVYATVGDLPLDFPSSVLTLMTLLLLQLTALTEEALKHRLKTMDQLSWREKKKKKNLNCFGRGCTATQRFKAV